MLYFRYFSNFSIKKQVFDGEKFMACKSIEMSRILYLYIREFLGDYPICVIDNACPIDVEYLYSFIREPMCLLPETFYDMDGKKYKFYIKSFENLVPFRQGLHRGIMETLKLSYLNNLDLLQCEMDGLFSYNILNDFKEYDMGAYSIDVDNRSLAPYVLWIKNTKLHEHDDFFNLIDYIKDVEKNNGSLLRYLSLSGEGAYFSNFYSGNTKNISQPEKIIHEITKDKLIEFLLKYRIKHKFIDEFLLDIENNKNIL